LKEIDIRPLVSRLEAQGLGVELLPADKSLKLPADNFDVILVPCLAFDDERHRLGWGGGWYDRFLARQPNALKIGLAYQDSFITALPQEPHDIKLDMIITEDSVY
jgi:5-formyltetrahydrofolate cyclo-ligase